MSAEWQTKMFPTLVSLDKNNKKQIHANENILGGLCGTIKNLRGTKFENDHIEKLKEVSFFCHSIFQSGTAWNIRIPAVRLQ